MISGTCFNQTEEMRTGAGSVRTEGPWAPFEWVYCSKRMGKRQYRKQQEGRLLALEYLEKCKPNHLPVDCDN